MTNQGAPGRRRLRDLGVGLGVYPPGPHNAITDVAGVRVGHCTLNQDRRARGGKRPIRTGVTAILPNAGNTFHERVFGGAFVLNGAGEMSGLIQVLEWGLIETPIMLTNTLSVGSVSAATVQYMVDRFPGIGVDHDVIIPVVGECDDSFLNDITGAHIKQEHVYAALDAATDGPVAEGSVGAGTGMVSFDLKGGIGTASRVLPESEGGYTLGALVLSNVGRMEDLRIDGVPVGPTIAPRFTDYTRRRTLYGSIIVVIATDAPLMPPQLSRLCKRAALGLGRVGSFASHGSGEIAFGFSTANTIPRDDTRRVHHLTILSDSAIDPLYKAVIECTEEAVINALCVAEEMVGADEHRVPALPLDVVAEMLRGR